MMAFRHETSCRCHWQPVALKAPQLLTLQIAKMLGAIFAPSNDLYLPIFLLSGQADCGSPNHARGLSTELGLKAQNHSPSVSLCLLGPGPCLVVMSEQAQPSKGEGMGKMRQRFAQTDLSFEVELRMSYLPSWLWGGTSIHISEESIQLRGQCVPAETTKCTGAVRSAHPSQQAQPLCRSSPLFPIDQPSFGKCFLLFVHARCQLPGKIIYYLLEEGFFFSFFFFPSQN